ncbi:MAG: YdcF family protein, partial [Methylobacterium sp.]|nr:YdcF family protein [Methylobacterium sp.]
RYAARLHRVTGLPVLVTGGRPEGGAAEAVLMAEALRTDFGIRPRWVERTSQNTADNARFSRDLLHPPGIDRVVLVTHGWHMRRAAATFAKAGFTVFPAPTMRYAGHPQQRLDLLPSAIGLMQSRTALHEWLGWLWYGLLGRI